MILGELSGLFLSLDGGETKNASLPVSQKFSCSFTPTEGKHYSIKILPQLRDGRKSFPFPGYNREYRVMYVKATGDDIARFYERFKAAYEGKNDSAVLSFLHDDWDAGDGTTIADLEENIRRSFRMYDEIKFDISPVSVRRPSPGRYEVSYDVTITSRIFDRNLKHEEKSSVVEQVSADDNGKLKITRTVSGRFWYVK